MPAAAGVADAVTAKAATVKPPSRRPRALAWLLAAPVVTAMVVAGVLFWRSAQTPALTSRDTVVLSSFTNRTGDAMFDDTLSEALAMQLRQSPFLNVLNEQQQQATLRQMGREPMSAVTPDVGREICQRNSGRALLGGSIAGLGSSYLITLSAQDCVTGDVLAEEQAQAGSKDEVLGSLGEASSRFRERLGESLASIQRYDAKIEQATTPSLDALKSYSQGVLVRRTEGDASAIPFFQRAIQQDPQFALAYARLGTVYSNLSRHKEAVEMTTRAYELRDRVSELERLYIEARYNSAVTRDTAKAIETYRVLLATFPNDYAAHTNLGGLLKDLGDAEAALVELKEAVRLAPEQPTAWLNMGHTYLEQRRYEEARPAFDRTLALVDSSSARSGLFVLAVLSGDQALADAQVDAMRGRRDEAALLPARTFAAGYRGRMRESAELMAQWRRAAEQDGRLESTTESSIGLAIDEALAGWRDRALARVAELQREKELTGEDADERLVLAAIIGDRALARAVFPQAIAALVEASDQRAPDERLLRALLALGDGNPEEATRLLTPVTYVPRFTPHVSTWAVAQRRLGNNQGAVEALEWLEESPSLVRMGVMPAYVLVELGRARMALGQADAARKAYDQFFELWKDADQDVPLLVEAKKEYLKLGS
jgi:tetratricopeptide (TPR) repeat protein